MTALTKDRDTPERGNNFYRVPVAAGVQIFAGALIALNEGGFAVPGHISATLKGFGRAEESVDNKGGGDGDQYINVKRGVFRFANSSGADLITRADIGEVCFICDDQTVGKTDGGGTRSVAGRIDDVDAGGVWVDFTSI